jgi:hypothetical protein
MDGNHFFLELFQNLQLPKLLLFCYGPYESSTMVSKIGSLGADQLFFFFKVSDPATDDQHREDKAWRVRELFNYFTSACKANYWPQCEIALDEAIKRFKGRCSFKQYIKNKPIRWGIKIFALCCAHTTYLWNCDFYLGKKAEDEKDQQKEQSGCKRFGCPTAREEPHSFYGQFLLLYSPLLIPVQIINTLLRHNKDQQKGSLPTGGNEENGGVCFEEKTWLCTLGLACLTVLSCLV